MKISAIVSLKKEVLDPQGKVVKQTLKNMGHNNIEDVSQGKYFEIELNENDIKKQKKSLKKFQKNFKQILSLKTSQ